MLYQRHFYETRLAPLRGVPARKKKKQGQAWEKHFLQAFKTYYQSIYTVQRHPISVNIYSNRSTTCMYLESSGLGCLPQEALVSLELKVNGYRPLRIHKQVMLQDRSAGHYPITKQFGLFAPLHFLTAFNSIIEGQVTP